MTDDTERLERYSGYERATAPFNDQLGSEEADAWRDHAPSESPPSMDDENDQ